MEVLRELNFKLFKMFNKIGNKFYMSYVTDLRKAQGRR
jgi:hypothetical protein